MLSFSYPPLESYQMARFCTKVSCVMKPALGLVIYTVLVCLFRIYYRNRFCVDHSFPQGSQNLLAEYNAKSDNSASPQIGDI